MKTLLGGVKVVELAGLGPVLHTGMMLADMGADVLQLRRAPVPGPDGVIDADLLLSRGRRVLHCDLKDPTDRDRALELIALADVVIEGFRPGVAERLGLGPDTCLTLNPRLVFGRLTGWGQNGPLASAAGHDINFLATTGLLAAMGPAHEPPVPPLSAVADFGGGSMLLLSGILAALFERERSGTGQVVDAAMADGAALLSQLQFSWLATGRWDGRRTTDYLNGSAPFYSTYECADGRHLAVGAMEEPFWRQLLKVLELDVGDLDRWDPDHWPPLRAQLAQCFRTRTQQAWTELFEGTDACVTPVLTFAEAPGHLQAQARGTHVELDGHVQIAPAPKFSRSRSRAPSSPMTVTAEQAVTAWS